MEIVRCASCDGYGWTSDDIEGDQDCDWCGGVGYVYRGADGVDRRIPAADLDALSEQLEQLEQERLRALGYSGGAKQPWDQPVRQAPGRKRLHPGLDEPPTTATEKE